MKKIFLVTALLAAFSAGVLVSLGVVFAQGAVTRFPDVDYKAYYGDAVNWANSNSFVYGYANGNFGPNDPLTRGQFVTILKLYDDQLVNAYRSGGVGKLQSIVCDGIKKDSLSADSYKTKYDDVCTQP